MTSLRIIFGVLFIIAAILKVYPVENFEIILVKAKIISWALSPFLARIIIGFELFLGFFILFNLFLKRILRLSLITIFVLSIFLVYVHFFISESTNCGCLGSIFPLTPTESILKNMGLFLLGAFILGKSDYKAWYWAKFRKPIAIFLFLLACSLPFILSTVDFPDSNTNYIIKPNMEVKADILKSVTFTNETTNLLEGRKLICFYSMTCPVCKISASKIALIHEQSSNKLPIYIIFLDNKNKAQLLPQFIEDTNIEKIPYTVFAAKDFFKISDNSVPFLMYLENGVVKNLSNYRDMSPEYVIDFLEGKNAK